MFRQQFIFWRTYKYHAEEIIYSKIGALCRLKRLVLANTMLLLKKSFVLSHFEYCNSLLMGIGKTLYKKLEDTNYYGLRTIMNMGKSTDYESILRMADMNTLEHRRIEQSLMICFKCFKENDPGYVANLFKPRVTPYNIRSNGLNVVQTSYNSRFLHGSYTYMISHIWNQLPSAVKNGSVCWSWVVGPKSWVVGPKSWVVGSKSWVVGPKSWVVGSHSWVVGSGLLIGRDLH